MEADKNKKIKERFFENKKELERKKLWSFYLAMTAVLIYSIMNILRSHGWLNVDKAKGLQIAVIIIAIAFLVIAIIGFIVTSAIGKDIEVRKAIKENKSLNRRLNKYAISKNFVLYNSIITFYLFLDSWNSTLFTIATDSIISTGVTVVHSFTVICSIIGNVSYFIDRDLKKSNAKTFSVISVATSVISIIVALIKGNMTAHLMVEKTLTILVFLFNLYCIKNIEKTDEFLKLKRSEMNPEDGNNLT